MVESVLRGQRTGKIKGWANERRGTEVTVLYVESAKLLTLGFADPSNLVGVYAAFHASGRC